MTTTISFIDGGSVTSPQGFSAGATYAGLKTFAEDKLDLGIIASDSPCTAAGVFTTSTIKSPTVSVNQAHLKAASPKGIIVNAGIANACVGEQGYKDAEEMASITANILNAAPSEILVCSTGVIGVELPMSLIRDGVANINLSKDGANQVARAMMTTDTRPKEVAVSCEIAGKTISIGGVAKGSGMIHPNMATMLSFITTDANVEQHFLEHCLTEVADSSYNMLTVDGDTSTNDTVLVLANGSANNEQITEGTKEAEVFQSALLEVAIFLTKELARDGEGASRLLSIEITGAKDVKSARQAARTIASSSLVKSAVYGSDPNWGRVLAALGRSEIEADETKIDLFVNGVCIMESGTPIPFHKEAVVVLMKGPEVTFKLQLNLGDASATAWGCDLTQEYVIINSAYTT
ncbi:MAG: bifunctional glutamate N-acetyltransferase/amino-acid acetyltransferase ArgJ [SAR202 cluster bacterium]|jgi:glutamate N-acetyltransferase/amino-acid N-acetyltransferase|nr:MAG: bifunctional glutamate N-acetyltransferase/amino-acid acetyltransferase ArgJ [SAR202 cluster bacterium]MCH2526755.1 bifunctional glutamate N-acetyltransferase/amino-acid acetyltransferase ArgJ [Dehalococcoidia bacterium]